MEFRTEQEKFWAGEFGGAYVARNRSREYLAANVALFSKVLSGIEKPTSIIEFGANIGMNLRAIALLCPGIDLYAVEINHEAVSELCTVVGEDNLYEGSIFDYQGQTQFDIALSKGLLIHLDPKHLVKAYEKLFQASSKYILLCEYYNPTPIAVSYRGHAGKLFKRDFAGEMLDRFPELALRDYGFCYKRASAFPQDDVTWFLLEKRGDSGRSS